MQSIILLHGAIGAADQLQPLKQKLAASHNVYTLNFSGHGAFQHIGILSLEFHVDKLSRPLL